MLLVGNGRERVFGLELGEMEENEPEEGEALSEDEAGVNPDVDFTYIDEKLEEVLGDIREGGVFIEDLGARLNGYGSFLPLYQRTPSFHSQTNTSPKESTKIGLISPFRPQHEIARVSTSRTSTRKNITTVLTAQPLTKSGEKSACETKSSNLGDNNVDHKRPKVLIKVGSDNIISRDAIYSGLGLVTSPSSSPEKNHDDCERSSPEFGGVPNDTPRSILQIMTCHPIPEEEILSPLHYSLLGLTEKGSPHANNCKARLVQKHVSDASTNFARRMEDVGGSEAKKLKNIKNKIGSLKVKKLHTRDDTTTIRKKDIHVDAPAEAVSDELNTLSSAGSTGDVEIRKSPQNADLSRIECVNNAVSADKTSSTNNILESTWSKEANGIGTAEDQTTYISRGMKGRNNLVEKNLEERRISQRTETCGIQGEDSGRSIEADYFVKTNSKCYKATSGYSIKSPMAFKNKHGQRASLFMHDGERIVLEDQLCKGSRKDIQGSTESPSDLCAAEITAPALMLSTRKEKGSHARSIYSKSIAKSKPHKEPCHNLGDEPLNMVKRANPEQVDDKLTLLNTNHNNKLTDVNLENEKSKDHECVERFESSVIAEPPKQAPAISDVPAPDGVSTSYDPLDSWVQCDRCQKWRLLPLGTSLKHLPSKWRCKMLNWLPGMNSCNVSEEETSKALYALHHHPVPESGTILNGHPNLAASTITTADGGHSNRMGKEKKSAAKDARSLPSQFTANQNLSFAVKTEERSTNTGKVDSLNQASKELSNSNKVDPEGSKSIKFTAEDAADNLPKEHAVKGKFLKESGKTLTSKRKRKVDGDDTLSSKKRKSEESYNSDSDTYGKPILRMDDGLSTKLSHKNLQKDGSSPKDLMCKLQDDNPSSKKSIDQALCGKELGNSCDGADIKNHDELSLKKRKMKQKDSHLDATGSHFLHGEHVNFKEDIRGSGSRKEKKAMSLKADGKGSSRSKADHRVNKVGRTTASEDCSKKMAYRNVDDHKQDRVENQGSASLQHDGHGFGSSKKDIPSKAGPDCNNFINLGSTGEMVTCRNVNSSSQGALDAIEKPEIAPGRRPQSLRSTSDRQQETTSTVKDSGSEVNRLHAANGVRLEVSKDPKTLDAQNAGNSNSSRLRGSNDSKAVAGTPIRKDCHSANAVFKEARELKHMANRIKNDGPDHESTTMYFQAALKYLHGASLLEPSNVEGDRHGELTRSLKMYSDTAKLLEFCAHEYEKRKEMAAAALAYKCMELAYFKVAYYKHPVASKDQQEWRAALVIHPLGESPSSSASDLDNLYNNCLVNKSAVVKDANSPQAAGLRAIAARPSNLTRLLDYMSDTVFAFEASRKSRNAVEVANARLDKYGSDGLASVRTVLDLSFHDVQELLRLVRLSIESIHV